MKKHILSLITILLFVYALLSLLSFRDNYRIERKLWGINHSLAYVASHLESTPDFTVDKLANRYRSFIKRFKRSLYVQEAQLRLGDLYSLRKDYAQALVEYQKALGPNKEMSALAEITMAKTYELEGHWNKALVLYENVINKYPLTNAGFIVPMYLTKHLVSEGQESYTSKAFADALAFYQRIAAEHPKSQFEYNALRMAAICELNQKDWSATVKTMGDIILKYPIGKALQENVNAINVICVTKLHDYDMAINIYREFIKQHPNHLANPVLKKMIKELRLLKSKHLIIRTSPATAAK